MHRQLSNKDCAITVLAHATGKSYTSVVNSFPDFRFLRPRPRTHKERADRIIGREQRVPRNPRQRHREDSVKRGDLEWNRVRYNRSYRTTRAPYFSHFGLYDEDYMEFLNKQNILNVQKHHATLEMLRKVRFALIAVPSLNVKTSSHMIIWRDGRIWDPSPKKRYDFRRLRQVSRMTILALCRDDAELDQMRRVLRVNVSGAEIMATLIWKLVESDEEATGAIKSFWEKVPPVDVTEAMIGSLLAKFASP